MSITAKVGIGLVVLMMFFGFGCAGVFISTNNDCVRQENGLEAQYNENQNRYSNYFNTLKEMVQVSSMYANDLRKVYDDAMKGRYGADGSKAVFQFIQEKNPSLDPSMYRSVQQAIQAGRASFEADQKTLLDRRRTYQDTLGQFPGNFTAHILGFPKVNLSKYDPVINNETSRAFETHRSEPIQLGN